MYTVPTCTFIPCQTPNPDDVEEIKYDDAFLEHVMSEARTHLDESVKGVEKKASEYAIATSEHNQRAKEMRMAGPDDPVPRIVVGRAQTTPPPGVDMSKLKAQKVDII